MITRTTPLDTQREAEVCRRLAAAWGCEIRPTGMYEDHDLFIYRSGRLVGLGEIKNRNNRSDHYPSVFLSYHKWKWLYQQSERLQVPGLFIVNFEDGLRFIRVTSVDPRRYEWTGRRDRADAPNDQECIILVPIENMKKVVEADGD